MLVGEFYIKGTVVVSNMLLQHFWKAPYKAERLCVEIGFCFIRSLDLQ